MTKSKLKAGQIIVSVIIPCYNNESTIKRAIDSILIQKINNIEIIIIDDGSTDKSVIIAKGMNITNLSIIEIEHSGVSNARNTGIMMAKGHYIAFLDSDDEWMPDKLSTQLKEFVAFPNLGFVSTSAEFRNKDGNLLKLRNYEAKGNILPRLLEGNIIVTSSVITRRDILIELLPAFRSGLSLGEDWLLWIRIAARYPCHVIKRPLVRYYDWQRDKRSNSVIIESGNKIITAIMEDVVLFKHQKLIVPAIRMHYNCVLANRNFKSREYRLFLREIYKIWINSSKNIYGIYKFFRIIISTML